MNNLLAPKDAALLLGISQATITRCVKLGAPVHRWGSTGHRYRINVDEFIHWMESQGGNAAPIRSAADLVSAEALAQKRRAAIRAL